MTRFLPRTACWWAVAPLLFAALLAAGGCAKRPAVKRMPMPLPAPAPKPVEPPAKIDPPVIATPQPELTPPPAQKQPQLPAPPPRQRRAVRRQPAPTQPKTTEPATAPQPGSADPSSAQPAAAAPQLTEILPADERASFEQAYTQNMSEANRVLSMVRNRPLSREQLDTVSRIRAFLVQARTARPADLSGAVQLARRAALLARDLARTLN